MTSGQVDGVWLTVQDAGAVGAVRRAAVGLGGDLRLPAQRLADLAIVATEIGSNLYKHTVDGMALVRVVRRGDAAGVEIVAVDKGPGMGNLDALLVDGRSTAGTLGIGLGAIVRLASEYDAYSRPGSGTVVTVDVWGGDTPPEVGAYSVRGITRPMGGEEVSGDGYASRLTDRGYVQLMLCDGLGHGPLAASAARAAEHAFRDAPETGPQRVLEHLHRALGHTRGAVVTVVEIEPDREVLRFAGVGNVAGAVITGGQRKGLLPHPGIIGHARPLSREVELPCPASATVVMHTDGVVDRWSLTDWPGLADRTPLVIAATLLREAGVRRDDAGVLVARRRPEWTG
jgi:anti-sigma regulatory factor (Ser/Thr protein kinase)